MEDYDVVKKIGEGSQGSVFHVVQKSTGCPFALKLMHCKDQEQVNFALKEIKALIHFRHEHIVSYIDFFFLLGHQTSTDGSRDLSVGLVMELCQNHNLADKIKWAKSSFMETGRHPFSEELISSWICQASDALQYIHDRGFLHRDLKPTNVFFSQQMERHIKLGDFGLATSAGLGKQSTVGTPYYFAPEILLRQTYDAKVDVWGLGVVMLELLTLRERPINTQVLENPLVVENLVGDITGMGFSVKLGSLIRDMLNRFPQGRPSPVAITRRLCGSQPLGTHLTPSNGTNICSLCEVDNAVVLCSECGQSFCLPCDAVKHKNAKRQSHTRSSLSVPQPTPVKISQFIEVPSAEFPSLTAALAAVDKIPSKTIHIVGGTTLRETIVFPSTCSPVAIIGMDPTPLIEVATSGPCVTILSLQGSLTNVRIRQIPSKFSASSSGSEICCALEVRRGEWHFENCQFESASGFAVACTSGDAAPVFSRCNITGAQQAGVLFTERAKGEMNNCSVERCGSTGILLKKGSAPSIRESKIFSNKETGIFFHESSGTLERNELTNNGGCAVVVKGANASPSLSGNLIADNSQAGIFCCDESTPRLTENKILRNGKAGILVKKFATPTVCRNIISNGLEAGVFVFESGSGTFSENEISDNSNAGVLVTTLGNPTFARNVIRKNAYEGVWICKGGAGVFRENFISENRRGSKDIEGEGVVWVNNRE